MIAYFRCRARARRIMSIRRARLTVIAIYALIKFGKFKKGDEDLYQVASLLAEEQIEMSRLACQIAKCKRYARRLPERDILIEKLEATLQAEKDRIMNAGLY